MNIYNVKDLALYIKQAKDKNQPFILFTGAGCSKSAGMPLASELVNEINQKHTLDLKILFDEDRQNYGKCMSALTKDDRRELLQGYIKNAKINWAHIVQALLLEQGYVKRIYTFNFDNLLARSCGLLGLYPSIYDFTTANLDLLDLMMDPAVVHLHGQNHGFVQLNTDDETKQHAEQLSNFVATTLNQSPSLFIGYSGQADAFFPLLTKKFSSRKKLFWVGREEVAPNHIEQLIIDNKVAHYLHHVDADLFFIELAQELGCFPPLLLKKPFDYLLKQLDIVLDFPIQENIEIDILTSTREKINKVKEIENNNNRPEFGLLLMDRKYEELLRLAKTVELEERDKYYIAWALIMQGNQLSEQACKDKSTELFEESFEKYKESLSIIPDEVNALYNWAIGLSELAKLKNSSELFKKSIKKYHRVLEINPDNIDALNNLAANLAFLSNCEEPKKHLCESIEIYNKALLINPDDTLLLQNMGRSLSALAEIEKSPEYFKQSIDVLQKALIINPDGYNILTAFGSALSKFAVLESSPSLFKQSVEVYRKALSIEPNNYETLNDLGGTLFKWANVEQCPEKFLLSIEIFKEILLIKPDFYEALDNFGGALLSLARINKDQEKLEEAKHKLQQAQLISKRPSYNLACLYALENNKENCKNELVNCLNSNILPRGNHIYNDIDLNNVREETWFRDLLEKLD
ncbi:SIR2 family protein [Photobacterium kishitanii]|uniref:SIR2 family protein n=1 Tax=Photobacterium kishitanii TaxID=318456 RepID=UPI000D165F51|nr:SIR2 family protein [Photobacterium kishitanii]PSV25671.1 hypothetical protein C0W28_00270 [Photobacterium kishitanii]